MAGPSTLALIDSVVGLGPLLEAIAAAGSSPALLKCNASELRRLGGVAERAPARGEAGGSDQDELAGAVRGLLGRYPAARRALGAIAVTDGARPAHLAALPVSPDETEFRLFRLPVVRLRERDSLARSQKRPSITSSWGQHSWIDLQSAIAPSAAAASASEAGDADGDGAMPDATVATHVYPIGAGDAVAAGTLAAWKVLADARNRPSRPQGHRLRGGGGPQQAPPQQQRPPRMHPDLHAALAGNESPAARALLAAFSFGLACGTASCLNEQNSVVDREDVLRFYNTEWRPIFLSSYQL
jgi:hypothetical protein